MLARKHVSVIVRLFDTDCFCRLFLKTRYRMPRRSSGKGRQFLIKYHFQRAMVRHDYFLNACADLIDVPGPCNCGIGCIIRHAQFCHESLAKQHTATHSAPLSACATLLARKHVSFLVCTCDINCFCRLLLTARFRMPRSSSVKGLQFLIRYHFQQAMVRHDYFVNACADLIDGPWAM